MRANSQEHNRGARQRDRTRRLILDAAVLLMRSGVIPTVEEAAKHAEVSAATGYRYYRTHGALIQEAVELAFPDQTQVSLGGGSPEARIDRLMAEGFPRLVEHEAFDRAVLRLALDQWLRQNAKRDLREPPVKRPGRKRFVDDILAPLRDRVSAQRLRRLELALGMVLGIESFIALRDIYGAEPGEIREVWRWVCKAMVRSALNQKRLAT